DEATGEGTIVYQIRPGLHFGLNPDNEASRLVGGREMTADDVVWVLKHATGTPYSYLYRATPELKVADITKTGPWEVTVKVPLDAMMTAIARFGDSIQIQAPEIHAKYGDADDGHGMINEWRPSSVGTGPYILIDNVPGSNVLLDRNPTYWMKDPVGPGEGNQLPYINTVRILVIPDVSTRQAALRTGKIDWLLGITWEDASMIRQTTPELTELAYGGGGGAFWMNSQRAPFDNVLVRRAALMATDLHSINDNLMNGLGQIHTYPWPYLETYKELYLALDDPDFPETAKELYVYNPEKAKQNLAEAGYPDGFKVDAIITATQVDYFAIIKDMWSKVGIDLQLEVREAGAANALKRAGDYDVARGGGNIISIFFTPPTLTSTVKSYGNVDDPKLHAGFSEIRQLAMTDFKGAMGMARELSKYIIDQVYGIPTPAAPSYEFWWPWLKGYSGEYSVGYFNRLSWGQYIWYDEDLKKSMGY
ncbi:MAG: ABC transporter substrate-binding protein, partial [Dehalococcoidales bacterium]|nr:ABC transporter substrate-binding protein [Dehalococcoidales bacterium]